MICCSEINYIIDRKPDISGSLCRIFLKKLQSKEQSSVYIFSSLSEHLSFFIQNSSKPRDAKEKFIWNGQLNVKIHFTTLNIYYFILMYRRKSQWEEHPSTCLKFHLKRNMFLTKWFINQTFSMTELWSHWNKSFTEF